MGEGKVQLRFDGANVSGYVSEDELAALQPRVDQIHETMEARQDLSKGRTGWLHLPSQWQSSALKRLADTAQEVRENADAFVVIGIGGSYLGARAAVEFLTDQPKPELVFAGYHLGSDELARVLQLAKEKSIYVNVVSREGTTVEAGVAFRCLWDCVQKNYSPAEARERILVTSRAGSPLQKLAVERKFRAFDIPDDVGGRYSAFTPVVLLPAAVVGADIGEMAQGGAAAEAVAGRRSLADNPAYRYAAIRKLLYDKGKIIEVLAGFDPALRYLGQWWRQLAGESEGKELKGIFPSTVDYTTDLHSMGQWMQQGVRNVFETFVTLDRTNHEILVPKIPGAGDGFDYLAGKTVSEINRFAYQATAKAHLAGDVPNMTFALPGRTARALGEFFYVFMRAIAMTGFLFDVNPFFEPGVNDYKGVMYKLLGKPGA